MAQTEFAISYDGPAIVDGRMPVRDLAPSLLALGNLFAEASALVYPNHPPPALSVKATRKGSFSVQLILSGAGGAWGQLVSLLNSEDATALANLEAIVIGGGGTLGFGLFALIRKLHGKKIVSQTTPDAGQVRLQLNDGTTIEAPAETFKLYRSKRVRQSAQETVSPLKRQGMDRLDFHPKRPKQIEPVSVKSDEVEFFDAPEDDETELTDDEKVMVVTIMSVSFSEGNKWRFSDGTVTFYAALEDEGFLERVELGVESFRNGDLLRCKIRVLQSLRGSALYTEYRVVEVIDHIPSGEQLLIEDDEGEEPDAGG